MEESKWNVYLFITPSLVSCQIEKGASFYLLENSDVFVPCVLVEIWQALFVVLYCHRFARNILMEFEITLLNVYSV